MKTLKILFTLLIAITLTSCGGTKLTKSTNISENALEYLAYEQKIEENKGRIKELKQQEQTDEVKKEAAKLEREIDVLQQRQTVVDEICKDEKGEVINCDLVAETPDAAVLCRSCVPTDYTKFLTLINPAEDFIMKIKNTNTNQVVQEITFENLVKFNEIYFTRMNLSANNNYSIDVSKTVNNKPINYTANIQVEK